MSHFNSVCITILPSYKKKIIEFYKLLTLWCPRAIPVDSPPLLPPQLAATRVDKVIHNYRPSTSP